MADEPKIKYQYNIFTDLIQPKGLLTHDKRVHACWYYYMLAHKAKLNAGDSHADQVVYEGQAWTTKPYANIAQGVATMYTLRDPGEFLQPSIIDLIRLQAMALGLPMPEDEYMVIDKTSNFDVN